jgi:multidrug efflux pump subunit AcrA (membrane-fusion protein)
MNRKLLTLLIVITLTLSACGGASSSETEATPTPFPTPVRPTYTVQRGDIVVNAKIFGRVTPKALHIVTFQMDGQVGEVLVNIGDVVTAGQVLGELREIRALREQAAETRRLIRNAQIDLEIAQLTLEKYKAEGKPAYDIQIQELEVERARLALEALLTELGIDPTTDALESLDAQIAKARAVAPADGTIIAVPNVGRNVTDTTPAFIIGDPNQLELVATLNSEVGEAQLAEMYEGMPVAAWRDATPESKLTGTIRQLPSPYGTGAEDSDIVIALDAAPSVNTYQSNDKMTVQIELANKTGVLWLPPDAIRSASGRTFVVINDASGPKRIEIQIGLVTLDKVEIISGLEEGQVVIGP